MNWINILENQNTDGRVITTAEVLPRGKGVQAPHWAPRLELLPRKLSAQNIWL